MLDIMIHQRADGTLYATIYTKPTHTDLYLNFASHHPLKASGVVQTLIDRANTVVIEDKDKTLKIDHVHSVWVSGMGFSCGL